MPDGSPSDLALLILCAPVAEALPGVQALAALSPQARVVADPAMAGALLARQPGVRLVVYCHRPEAWIALSLGAGQAPSLAVRSWHEGTRGLLALLRARRRQAVLIFDDIFAAAPADCAAALGLPAPTAPVPRPVAEDAVLIMIARAALRRDPAAQALAEELQATALAPAMQPAVQGDGPDAVFHAYTAGLHQKTEADARLAEADARLAEADARLASLEHEAGLLRTQVTLEAGLARDATSRLDGETQRTMAAQAEAATARAQLVAADARLTDADTRRAAADARLAALDHEAGLLRTQVTLEGAALAQVQAELSTLRAAETRAKAGQSAAEARIKALEKAADADHAARTKTEGDLQQMITQLRAQIHQMGQGLESYQVQLERLEAERAEFVFRISQLQEARDDLEGYYDRARQYGEQIDRLGAEMGQVQAHLAERDQHLAEAWAEIGRIHRSRSYRLMTPLRRIRQAVG